MNTKPNQPDASRVMSYSRICLETDFSNGMPAAIRNQANLVTFTSPNSIKNQPLYANLPVVQPNDANIISVPVNPNTARFVQNHGQSHIYNNTAPQ